MLIGRMSMVIALKLHTTNEPQREWGYFEDRAQESECLPTGRATSIRVLRALETWPRG